MNKKYVIPAIITVGISFFFAVLNFLVMLFERAESGMMITAFSIVVFGVGLGCVHKRVKDITHKTLIIAVLVLTTAFYLINLYICCELGGDWGGFLVVPILLLNMLVFSCCVSFWMCKSYQIKLWFPPTMTSAFIVIWSLCLAMDFRVLMFSSVLMAINFVFALLFGFIAKRSIRKRKRKVAPLF